MPPACGCGPGAAGLHVAAYPPDTDPAAIANANSIIEKRYTRLALTWHRNGHASVGRISTAVRGVIRSAAMGSPGHIVM